MARLVYFAPPFFGHVNPALAIARKLVQQGHDVHFFCTDEFGSRVARTGVTFHSYRSGLNGRSATLLDAAYGAEIAEVCPQVFPDVQRLEADAALIDFLCPWGRAIALALGLPELTVHTTYAPPRLDRNPVVEGWLNSIDIALARNGPQELRKLVPWQVFTGQQRSALICTVREFQPMAEELTIAHQFTGPCIDDERCKENVELSSDQPIVYVSHSTLFGRAEDLRRHVLSLVSAPNRLIVASGTAPRGLAITYGQVQYMGHAPQLAILKRATAFVTHGGNTSAMEAVSCGVPMLCLPDTVEQQSIALQATRAQIALSVKAGHETMDFLLPLALAQIMTKEFRDRSKAFSDSIRGQYSVRDAVEVALQTALA